MRFTSLFSLPSIMANTTTTTTPVLYDALIIGGGPAGLATASALSRQLRPAVLFDSGLYRNARAAHMHNYLGFDHVPPAEFRAKAKADLKARYDTTTFVDREVVSVAATATPGIFKAVDAEGAEHYGRRVVLATGVTDMLPEIPGMDECWGRVVFHCLFCHGFEERGAVSAGILMGGMATTAAMAMHFAGMAGHLAETITIYTNGDETLTDEVVKLARNPPYQVDPRVISQLEMLPEQKGIVLHFTTGPSVTERFVAHAPRSRVNGPFAEQLGLEMTGTGDIKVTEPFRETTVKGVFATGDCATPIKAVAVAVAHSALTGAGVGGSCDAEPRPELSML
ncbi:hypothetical protein F5X68DRAFT_216624 [Plectosphaerella plurivora]|uniref:FAD/NAD(P)-binding domain-containing protein n=1 Tax=Plectosphaerella plurivora TaxID=936078 RepID=A0A9P8V317_9PEZI|nr:hypothetical protein F5X68DRAFT_216624 [Plectosphaerella plurivora]